MPENLIENEEEKPKIRVIDTPAILNDLSDTEFIEAITREVRSRNENNRGYFAMDDVTTDEEDRVLMTLDLILK